MTSVSPGWYPDPAAPETQRYWDGEQWVGAPLPVGSEPPSTPPAALPPPAMVPTPAPEPAPVSPPPPVPLATDQLAPLQLRLIARIVDVAALVLLNVLANGYFFVQFYREMQPTIQAWWMAYSRGENPAPLAFTDKAQTLQIIIALVGMGLWFAYEVPATANSGQTLGKRLLGIKVARIDDGTFTFFQSIRRWMIVGLPSIIGAYAVPVAILDALWCTWDRPARQCLHDKFAQTVVVLAPPPTRPLPGRDGDAP